LSEEYEVPSPHEHVLEEEIEGERKESKFTQKVALMTATLACIAALVNYQSGKYETAAAHLKNESILKQAKASDQWAYFQSKSVKAHIDDGFASVSTDPGEKARFIADNKKQSKEKDEVKAEAQKLEEESMKLGEDSEANLKPHERLALAGTFIQMAIALAALTIITKKHWLLWGSICSAAAGLVIAATSFAAALSSLPG